MNVIKVHYMNAWKCHNETVQLRLTSKKGKEKAKEKTVFCRSCDPVSESTVGKPVLAWL